MSQGQPYSPDHGKPASQPVILQRQTYNLQPGSVRILLILLIFIPFWVLLALPQATTPTPGYLWFLMALSVMYFFAWHEHERPLGIPAMIWFGLIFLV